MKTRHKELVPLEFEIGKTYKTKFATGETFTVTRIRTNRDENLKRLEKLKKLLLTLKPTDARYIDTNERIELFDSENKEIQLAIYGIYGGSPHLGECPIGIDRVIPISVPTGNEYEVHTCPHCNKSFREY